MEAPAIVETNQCSGRPPKSSDPDSPLWSLSPELLPPLRSPSEHVLFQRHYQLCHREPLFTATAPSPAIITIHHQYLRRVSGILLHDEHTKITHRN